MQIIYKIKISMNLHKLNTFIWHIHQAWGATDSGRGFGKQESISPLSGRLLALASGCYVGLKMECAEGQT